MGVQKTNYPEVNSELEALLEKHWITNLANASALLNSRMPDINWLGFYLSHGDELILGPFQGQPACLRIPMGKGVCGTAAAQRKSMVVPDVHAFPGHIACDARSRSEIVIPMIYDGRVLGVLDVDSPSLSRFDENDRLGLEKAVGILVRQTNWPKAFSEN